MAFIVVVDAVCTSADINARAADSGVSETFAVISDLCLALYTIELSAPWSRETGNENIQDQTSFLGVSAAFLLERVLVVYAG